MKTPISYYGGKQRLANRIIKLIPEHTQYVEPFFGGGAVFFKKEPSQHEVINDLDNRVINFYDVLKNHYYELEQRVHSTLHSEKLHNSAKYILQTGGTVDYLNWSLYDKINQAWAFYVQTNMSFGCKINAGFAFGNIGKCTKQSMNKRLSFTDEYCKRVEKVEIFCRDAINLIKLKDKPGTFFYIDPPYFNSDCGHYAGYSEYDFLQLLDTLSNLKSKFILSSYDSLILQEYISANGWKQEQLTKPLSVNNVNGIEGSRQMKTECLTFNYAINGPT